MSSSIFQKDLRNFLVQNQNVKNALYYLDNVKARLALSNGSKFHINFRSPLTSTNIQQRSFDKHVYKRHKSVFFVLIYSHYRFYCVLWSTFIKFGEKMAGRRLLFLGSSIYL